MKNLIPNGPAFIVVIVLMAWSSPVLAQEELGPIQSERTEHMELPDTDSKPSLNKTALSTTREALRDSIGVRPVTSKKPESKNDSKDDILSFNFLYYIIQKYKLSDIVN